MGEQQFEHKKVLSVFSLCMITIGSVDAIRNLPAAALFGSQLIFYYIIAALFFLIPCAFVSAELASTWPEQGGIYVWVREAFGKKVGLLAIWYSWIENVIWYPAILSFVGGTVGYLINPALIHNKVFLVGVILTCFWGATFINLRGMQSSARFSGFCTTAGLIIPMALIIGLGLAWIGGGHPLQVSIDHQAFLPHLHQPTMWVALTGVVLSLCGIEIATVHAGDVKNPQRAFPIALLYSVVTILITMILGALAIAIVLPVKQISLVAGIMQAFEKFFAVYHLHWFVPVLTLMLVIGALGSVSNWIIAPTKGLLIAARDGHLPPMWRRVNAHGAPTALLMTQGAIVSVLTMVFLFMPSINGSYWLLTVLAAQLYMFMYIIMFVTGIYLKYKQPHRPRPYAVPFGNTGMWVAGSLGLIGCIVTIVVGFIPPSNIAVGSTWHYETLLIIGLVVMSLPPFIMARNVLDNNTGAPHTA